MPLTLTDEQVAEWRRQQEVAERNARTVAFMQEIYDDPELGNDARALIKRKHPKMRIDDYDTRQEMLALREKDRKEREEAEAKAKEEAEVKSWNDDLEAVRKEYSFTDEGMAELDKFMRDNKVYNPKVAAAHIVSQRPQPSQDHGGFDSQYLYKNQLRDSEDNKKLFADPDKWMEDTLVTGIRELNQPMR